MTHVELLNDTVEYYKNNPRAVDAEGKCNYKDETGAMCAVGRWIDPNHNQYNDLINFKGYSGSLFFKYACGAPEKILKHEVKNIKEKFWIALQGLHDERLYWRLNNKQLLLSDSGLREYNRILLLATRLDNGESYKEDN